jgi:hypothetical protein
MYNACGHLWTGTTRQGNKVMSLAFLPLLIISLPTDIQIEVTLRMHIRGLVTVPVSSRSITGIDCPFELPSNGV